MPLKKSESKEAVSTNIREMMASGYPQKQAVAASLNIARKYGKAAGGPADEGIPEPRSLMDYGKPPEKPEHIATYPETAIGNVAPAGEIPRPGPVPFDINPQPKPQTGIMERAKEGWKAGFGDDELGINAEGRQYYPLLNQPFFRPDRAVDFAMRAVPGAIGALGGAGAGLYEKATGDTVGANRMQRDAHIAGQYPAGGGLASGLTHFPQGAAKFALNKAKEIGQKIPDPVETLVPQNSLGAFGGKPPKGTYDQILSGAAGYDIEPTDLLHFKKVGEQKGTNPGGFYQAPDGTDYYIKTPKTADHVRNEKLAAELYKLAGVDVPDLKISNLGGKDVIASPIQKGDVLYDVPWVAESAPGLRENFVVDAWLGNYDAVGTGKDNIVIGPNGNAYRIDLGGSLRYRAQGKLKDKFGPEVTELETMRDPSINWDGYEVFGDVTPEQLKVGAQKVAAITDDQIRELVNKYGPIHQNKKAVDKLADTLIARRDYIKKYMRYEWDTDLDNSGSPSSSDKLHSAISSAHDVAAKKVGHHISDAELLDKYPMEFGQHMIQQANHNVNNLAKLLFDLAAEYGAKAADKVVTSTPEFAPYLGDIDGAVAKITREKGFDPWQDGSYLEGKKSDRRNPNKKEYTDDEIEEYYAKQHEHDTKDYGAEYGNAAISGSSLDKAAQALKPVDDYKEIFQKYYGEDAIPVELTSDQIKNIPKEMRDKMVPYYVWKGGYPDTPWGQNQSINDKGSGFTRSEWYHRKPGMEEDTFGQSEITNKDIRDYISKDQYFNEVMDPKLKDQSYEPAFFTGHVMRVAHGYGEHAQPFIAFAKNPAHVNFADVAGTPDWNGYPMTQIIKAARNKNHDVIFVHGITDNIYGTGWKQSDRMHMQVLFLDTHGTIKSPHAEMKDWQSRLVHSGIGGVGIIGAGMFLEPQQAQAEPEKKADGGAVGYTHPIRMKRGGMLNSSIPGRTDKIPINVPAGAYVLPADIPSALGQGNTMAGGEILQKMFTSGPYGMKTMRPRGRPQQMRWMQPPRPFRVGRAEGGPAEGEERVPIIAAGGEFIIHPEKVMEIGEGSMQKGHDILDKFVLSVRRKHISTLKGLKPPKR